MLIPAQAVAATAAAVIREAVLTPVHGEQAATREVDVAAEVIPAADAAAEAAAAAADR